jgi:beta-N-acetylhexosaminidase
MTLAQKVGQMFMCSLLGTDASAARSFLQRWQPGGVTLFANNITSVTQVASLTSGWQKSSVVPLLISVDQEGGEVTRIQSRGYVLPSEAVYGQQNSPSQLYSDTRKLGSDLRSVGINMNLAPVADVLTNPNSPIGSRSFGSNALEDALLTTAAIRGYQSGGVAATAKHFLGLGSSSVNAESGLPYVRLARPGLDAQLAPFRSAVEAHVDAIMVTHVILAGVTAANTPASLSHNVVTNVIGRELGYKGVTMTDSLGMGSVAQFAPAQAALMAVRAGEDMILIGGAETDATGIVESDIKAIVQAVNDGRIGIRPINLAARRVIELKLKLHLIQP